MQQFIGNLKKLLSGNDGVSVSTVKVMYDCTTELFYNVQMVVVSLLFCCINCSCVFIVMQ